jgi:hypothetical protein
MRPLLLQRHHVGFAGGNHVVNATSFFVYCSDVFQFNAFLSANTSRNVGLTALTAP